MRACPIRTCWSTIPANRVRVLFRDADSFAKGKAAIPPTTAT
jgi:hypothetical protein